MSGNKPLHSSKTQQRPSSTSYARGSLAIGLRIVYTGKKAKRFPRATQRHCLLDTSQRAILLDDLAHLSRKLGGANPRKDDTQVSGVIEGCIEVVWPELRRRTMRYEDILTEVSKLDALSNAYLAERSISCLIVYSLPPATTSLFKYAPWDEPCLFVGDGITVDRTLAVRCRASLVREKRLDQMLAKQQLHHDDMRDCRGERRRSPRSGNRSSTRHSDNSRSRQDQTYSPVRSPSPPQVYSPPPLIPRRMRSRSRSHSPPRKRLRTTTDEDERSILLEAIKEVRRERDVAFEREDVLRHQLSMATEEKKALTLLERQVEAWTSTVETCEKRVHAYERRFCLLLDIERETAQTSGSSIVASGDVSSLGMLEGVIRDYKLRERRARRETAKVQASYNRRMDVLNGKGSSSGGQSFSNALSAVAQLAASIAS